MTESITVNKTKFYLNGNTYTSPKGRPFRHSSTEMNFKEAPAWINGMYSHKMIYSFRYLDTHNEFFFIEVDQQGKSILIKNSKTLPIAF